jgi:hypothetical protein
MDERMNKDKDPFLKIEKAKDRTVTVKRWTKNEFERFQPLSISISIIHPIIIFSKHRFVSSLSEQSTNSDHHFKDK